MGRGHNGTGTQWDGGTTRTDRSKPVYQATRALSRMLRLVHSHAVFCGSTAMAMPESEGMNG